MDDLPADFVTELLENAVSKFKGRLDSEPPKVRTEQSPAGFTSSTVTFPSRPAEVWKRRKEPDPPPDTDICATLPDSLEVTIDGIESCGCVDVGDTPFRISDVDLSGTFEFVKAEGDNFWRAEIGTFTYTAYFPGAECSGSVASVSTVMVAGFITCGVGEDGVTRLTLILTGRYDSDGYPLLPGEGYFPAFSGSGELGEAIDSTYICGVSAPGIGSGTAMIEIDDEE